MVRTKADGAPKAVAAKAPRKVLGSSRAGGAGPSCASPGNPGNKYAGGNPVCPRPTPEWQKGIDGFFSKKQKTDKENTEPLNGEAGGSSAGPCPMEVEVEVEPQPKGKGKGKGKSSSKAKAGSSKDSTPEEGGSSEAAGSSSSSNSSSSSSSNCEGGGSGSSGTKRKSPSPEPSPVKRNGIIDSDSDDD